MTLAFLDTNILVYAFSDDARAGVARDLLQAGGVISVQCLNEFASVLRRKQRCDWARIHSRIATIRDQCAVLVHLDPQLHVDGLRVAERYRFSVYDGMIAAAALTAGCDTLYSEDMHAGLVVEGRLTITNPFA